MGVSKKKPKFDLECEEFDRMLGLCRESIERAVDELNGAAKPVSAKVVERRVRTAYEELINATTQAAISWYLIRKMKDKKRKKKAR